jgi:hypothetical protein
MIRQVRLIQLYKLVAKHSYESKDSISPSTKSQGKQSSGKRRKNTKEEKLK